MKQEKIINRLLTILLLDIVLTAILLNISEFKVSVYRMKSNIELTTKK